MKDKAVALGKLLEEHKASDIAVLDMTELNSWTDYFVIATANSFAHTHGLYKVVREFAEANDLDIHHGGQKRIADDDQWLLVDMGSIVVHLMLKDARSFYNLENLWFEAKKLYISPVENTVQIE